MPSVAKTLLVRAALCLLLLPLTALLARLASAQSATPAVLSSPYAEAQSNARKIAAELIARGIPGLAIAVAVDGKLAYAEGFGYADIE